jgi:hypothetical protein
MRVIPDSTAASDDRCFFMMAAPGHPERTDGWSQTSSEPQRLVDLDQGSLLWSDAGIDTTIVPTAPCPPARLPRHRSASAGFLKGNKLQRIAERNAGLSWSHPAFHEEWKAA